MQQLGLRLAVRAGAQDDTVAVGQLARVGGAVHDRLSVVPAGSEDLIDRIGDFAGVRDGQGHAVVGPERDGDSHFVILSFALIASMRVSTNLTDKKLSVRTNPDSNRLLGNQIRSLLANANVMNHISIVK